VFAEAVLGSFMHTQIYWPLGISYFKGWFPAWSFFLVEKTIPVYKIRGVNSLN
jgi:hypothetical protein